jgi:chromosome segregation ATPase
MIMALFTKKTDAAAIGAELTAKRTTFAQVQQEIRDLKTKLATNEVRRGQLHVAAALDGQDVRADLQALDSEDRQLQQQVAQQETAARPLPMVIAELEKRHAEARRQENLAQRQGIATRYVDLLRQLDAHLLAAGDLQQQLRALDDEERTLRGASEAVRPDGVPAPSLLPDRSIGPDLTGIAEVLERAKAGKLVW